MPQCYLLRNTENKPSIQKYTMWHKVSSGKLGLAHVTCTLENGSMTRMRFCSSRLSYSLARCVLIIGSSLSSALYSVRAWKMKKQQKQLKILQYTEAICVEVYYKTSLKCIMHWATLGTRFSATLLSAGVTIQNKIKEQ